MLPPFDENGNLPPGIHVVTNMNEIANRFGPQTAKRSRDPLTRSLRELISLSISYGATGVYVNGSYITKKPVPTDVDIAIVFPDDFDLENHRWRFVDAFESAGLDVYVYRQADAKNLGGLLAVWTMDREFSRPKGIIYMEVKQDDQE